MAVIVTLEVRGLAEVQEAIQKLGSSGARIAQSALGQAANEAVQDLKMITPVQSGALQRAWGFVFQGHLSGVIKNTARHFVYVELGTGPKAGRDLIRPTTRRALAFSAGGAMVFAKYTRGQAPRYLLDRFDEDKFYQSVANKVEDSLRSLGVL